MAFPTNFDLANLNGSNGFILNGIDVDDLSGSLVSNAGDINGDGFDDILIGATDADPSGNGNTGEMYVVFGSNQPFNQRFNLATLNGSNGFIINGFTAGDDSDFSLSSAGDINGDGFDDILIGTTDADPNGNIDAGETYVIFGSNQGFSPRFDLNRLNGSNGFVLSGLDADDASGHSVSNAGDVNGDGFDDLLIGAYLADPLSGGIFRDFGAGETYVVFGSRQGFSPEFALESLNGRNGFVIDGIDVADFSGYSVSGAGDVNGDGLDDVLIGAIFAAPNGVSSAGETYVVFGSNQGFSASFELDRLNGRNGFVINGIDEGDWSGYSVNSAGDINGDGFDDILVGARSAESTVNLGTGETYVVFGSNQGFSPSLDLARLNGRNGFVINGIEEEDWLAHSIDSAGDVNGDGLADILIGTSFADSNGNIGAGETYVVFGTNQGFSASLDLSRLNGRNGFSISGIDAVDFSGSSVSSAGDVNNDGFDDILIGAGWADPNGNDRAGETYVVFGRASTTAIEWNTETGVVSSFGISLSAGKASTTPIGRTIQDRNWELQTTGDLNGDGEADVILRHALAGQNLVWYMAPGGQSIQSEALIGRDIPDTNWSIGGTGDLNGDGKIDLILRNQAADQIVAWYMDGNGGIQSEGLIGRGLGDNNWKIEATADFNGDGKSDIVLRNGLSGQNLLWEMDGGTILAESLIGRDIPDQNWHIEGARDFDNNGTVDLFLRHRGAAQGLLWSMADKTTIASEQAISNVSAGVSQLVF